MDSAPGHIIGWVGSHILPHESDVRAWLRRAQLGHEDIEDIVQESYCRMAALSSVDHIASPRGYFFTVAKNIALMRVRRARIVRIESVDEIDRLDVMSDAPSPEQITVGRSELARLKRLIASLPTRCRRIFEMRKIQGLPQKEIARVMGVSETIVENESAKALRLIMRSIASEESHFQPQKELKRDTDANRN
ncbi:sigma-70 family RNA polymerase sigma factor [Asticcacaulis sp. 201]|uniref:RNA polymerase sigma factor n=1 Tax=Asticcacaulis sp. 201 TaxID=3028787 RepID=UPI0029168491|nr:sigma-70 family RNA polymerase sigma factor [Asticcacaulis sp. 201]MDV6331131.1 sigma-70 family RNA polymerase sigma factor [Asticcacaulis sp. 201]